MILKGIQHEDGQDHVYKARDRTEHVGELEIFPFLKQNGRGDQYEAGEENVVDRGHHEGVKRVQCLV